MRQGDPRWRSEIYGNGTHTIGAHGCLLVAIVEASWRLSVPETIRDPRPLNTLGKENDAFDGGNAYSERLAKLAGLKCGPELLGDVEILRPAIVNAIVSGKLALLHVGYGAASRMRHWVLGVAIIDDSAVTYCDPATGRLGQLPLASLTAPSDQPDHRVYTVRAARILSRF